MAFRPENGYRPGPAPLENARTASANTNYPPSDFRCESRISSFSNFPSEPFSIHLPDCHALITSGIHLQLADHVFSNPQRLCGCKPLTSTFFRMIPSASLRLCDVKTRLRLSPFTMHLFIPDPALLTSPIPLPHPVASSLSPTEAPSSRSNPRPRRIAAKDPAATEIVMSISRKNGADTFCVACLTKPCRKARTRPARSLVAHPASTYTNTRFLR